MNAFLLDLEPHSRRSFVSDPEHPCSSCIVPDAAIEEARANGARHTEADCVGCPCGKCHRPMDLSASCRFYELRGGLHDGKRVAAHAHCVKESDAIEVSSASAVEILVRQRKECRKP